MRIILPVAAILTAIILLTSMVAPAYAAPKIIDTRIQNAPFGPFPTAVCGAPGSFSGNFDARLVIWDSNGDGFISAGDKLSLKLDARGKIVDANGQNDGTFNAMLSHLNINPGSLPINFQINAKVTCNGQGQIFNLHLGATVDENGIVHLH